ncbi:trimeric intracellular cation channel family protein [Aeromicrobium phragmitis]|uniref:Trimeric intracellular cation channel family protein n=2 Tax=Aeromicrobium phragmitis TaxID=2478914 RepID=A0A3L8PJL2_9ACTN|nr:trimeric intracellular cation channel family protein [Aeromicrobium phragmitis]
MTGALVAARRDFDIVGLLVLAMMTGLGGGVIRDVLLGVAPPVNVASWERLLTATLAAALVFWQHDRVSRREPFIMVLDAVGLATFCVTGAIAALDHEIAPATGVLLGVITAIGGGVVRDVLSGRTPVVFSGELYAIPAVVGATLTVVLESFDPLGVLYVIPAVLCFGLRLVSMRRGWSAPGARSRQ